MEVFLNIAFIFKLLLHFLHVHGGVSDVGTFIEAIGKFSPCAWRCFHVVRPFDHGRWTLSICMEMFALKDGLVTYGLVSVTECIY